ncbi:MAG: SH3 domain-containing protein [Syntrophorhabdaceae bacterium]|nr:SH3 domain-containing protein [Syntrophorhabdaceae bacterium]MDD5244489.1 SH3 domain-containing protein [Syntrophorhabdaceae bacterium]
MKISRILIGVFFAFILCSSTLDALCVKVTKANLRTGPGTNYEVGWTVYKYMPFEKVGMSLSGNWYAVKDVDSTVLWIYRNLLTSKYRCAVVNTEGVNVRTGPGVQYGKRFGKPMEKYYSARILKKKGAWLKIIDGDNETGWIRKDYVWIR